MPRMCLVLLGPLEGLNSEEQNPLGVGWTSGIGGVTEGVCDRHLCVWWSTMGRGRLPALLVGKVFTLVCGLCS